MKKQHPILTEIDAFLEGAGLSETYFGKQAVNNSELMKRLRAGGGLHFDTEARVREFMASYSPSSSPALSRALLLTRLAELNAYHKF